VKQNRPAGMTAGNTRPLHPRRVRKGSNRRVGPSGGLGVAAPPPLPLARWRPWKPVARLLPAPSGAAERRLVLLSAVTSLLVRVTVLSALGLLGAGRWRRPRRADG
jgi:hypothetical protein